MDIAAAAAPESEPVDNHDIDRFFAESGLTDRIDRQDRPPTATWIFQAGRFPVLIQTQENVNRMRIVVFIGDAGGLGGDELVTLMEANYHTALDVRYALADDQLVAAFLHPFRELTLTQFILGLYQVVNCAETCGTTFSGGTMVFGGGRAKPRPRPTPDGAIEQSIDRIMDDVVRRIAESA